MSEPSPATHDMTGLRQGLRVYKRWNPDATDADLTRVAMRFRRHTRLHAMACRLANRHHWRLIDGKENITIINDDRIMTVRNHKHTVRILLDGPSGEHLELMWTRDMIGFDTEVNLLNRCANSWLGNGRLPSAKPAMRI